MPIAFIYCAFGPFRFAREGRNEGKGGLAEPTMLLPLIIWINPIGGDAWIEARNKFRPLAPEEFQFGLLGPLVGFFGLADSCD